MASRISQMRNGALQQPYPQTQQGQLNNSIAQIRELMQQIRNSSNPKALLTQFLQNNPNTAAISSMLKNNGSLESIAREMAQVRGIDINELIKQLQGGM
jgi:hypothetical protein